MARLIDADRLKADFIGNRYGTQAIEYVIDEQPTVNVCPYWDNESDYCALNKPSDAEPVRHGSWYKTYDDEGEAWMCSECCEEWAFEEGHPKDVYGCNYCPYCGAKMDGERREDAKTD